MIWFRIAWTVTLIVIWLLFIFSKTTLGFMAAFLTMVPIVVIVGITINDIIEFFNKNKFK